MLDDGIPLPDLSRMPKLTSKQLTQIILAIIGLFAVVATTIKFSMAKAGNQSAVISDITGTNSLTVNTGPGVGSISGSNVNFMGNSNQITASGANSVAAGPGATINYTIYQTIQKTESEHKAQLLAEFSEGYSMVGIEGDEIFIPKSSALKSNPRFRIDWGDVRIQQRTTNSSLLTLGEITMGGISMYGGNVPLSHAKGFTHLIARVDPFTALAKVYEVTPDGIVVVVGVDKKTD